MSAVQPTDKTLVNRAGVDYSTNADMSTVQNTDLLLINRAGVDYKCTFADWKASQVNIKTPSITSPAAGAADLGETPTFTSSAFSGSGTAHVSSDWQVTLATDTAFASPVVQSMADTTNKVSWNGGPLQANTDYIVRVRHNGGSISSAWSAVVAFKTDVKKVPTAAPGNLYKIDGTGALIPYTCAVKLINCASASGTVGGVGADGKFYAADSTGSALSAVSAAPASSSVVALSYNSNATTYAGGARGHVTPAGDCFGNVSIAGPAHTVRLSTAGCVTDMLLAVTAEGNVWAFGTSSSYKVGSQLLTVDNAWVKITFAAHPSGATIQAVAACGGGSYDAPNVALLYSDGSLWVVSTTASGRVPGLVTAQNTNATPTQVNPGTKFKMINTAGGNYSAYGALSAVTDSGQLWYGATASASFTGAAYSWQAMPGETDWAEPIFGPYVSASLVAGLKKDGKIYFANTSSPTFKPVTGATYPVIHTLGSARLAQNLSGAGVVVVIPS